MLYCPHRESNEESPESRRLFGAGLGARSPQRTPRGKNFKTNMTTQRGTKAAPPAPFSVLRPPRPLATPSGSPQRNGQTRSEPAKADNRADITRTHYWRSRPDGTGTQDTASRPVWRKAANSRRDRTQNAAIGTRDRLEMNARHSDGNARRRPIAGTHSNGEQNACGRQLPHGGGLARRS